MYRKIPLSIEVKKVLKMLIYTLCIMLVALSGYYFIKASGTAGRGYLLRENQLRQKTLESENRILKQQVLDAQSLKHLKRSNVVTEMGPAEKPIYIEPKGPLTRRK